MQMQKSWNWDAMQVQKSWKRDAMQKNAECWRDFELLSEGRTNFFCELLQEQKNTIEHDLRTFEVQCKGKNTKQ